MHCADGFRNLLRHTIPTNAGLGFELLTGALIRRGEADAEISATGATNEIHAQISAHFERLT